jgi:hypothetical protein
MIVGNAAMTQVVLGLTTSAGDQLGHLVRGIQMLRSYGQELVVQRYSAVMVATDPATGQPALHCLVAGTSDATLDGLRGICRETEWALGDDPRVLQVALLRYGDTPVDQASPPTLALMGGAAAPDTVVLTSSATLAAISDWGQQGGDDHVIGEWPDATGG